MKPLSIVLITVSMFSIAACREPAVEPPADKPAVASEAAGSAAIASSNQFKLLTDTELSAPLTLAPGNCNIEAIDFAGFDAKVFDLERKEAVVAGWLLPPAGTEAATAARLRMTQADGKKAWEVPLTQRVSRQDVVTLFGGKSSDMPGFNQPVDFMTLQPGVYRMVLIYNVGAANHVCDNGREINLK